MFYSFNNADDFKVIFDISNNDLCQLNNIKTVLIYDILLNTGKKNFKLPQYNEVPHILLSQNKTPCNLDTFLKVYALQKFLTKDFWPTDQRSFINFLGSRVKAGHTIMNGDPYSANLFPALGIGSVPKHGLLRILDNQINPFNDYVAYYE